MLAIIDAYRAGLLKPKYWLPNLAAGLIVGVVALPLAMAFAIASGVKPEQGLYTAIIAAFIVGVFGGSRVQIAGPTGAFVVILANITAQYGVAGLQLATLFAGFILVFMGISKLGSAIKFIPDPVIVGFTSGIGVIIFVGEWKDFFGLAIETPINAHFYLKLLTLIKALPSFNLATTGLACLSLLLVLITPKFFKRIPGPLVAMLVATMLQAIFHYQGVATIGSMFGGIPQALPRFHLPEMTLNSSLSLIAPAFTIALLGAIESLLSAAAADHMTKTRHHSNQELIGQGLANIIVPFFGGFAATGAIARTATNVRNGGNSPLAAIAHSVFLILVIVLLAPLAMYIPLCTLAAILFVVAYNMSDIPHFIYITKHAPSYDLLVLFATFFLTVFTNLVVAVNIGIILAMLFFIRRMNQFVSVEKQNNEMLHSEFSAENFSLPKDAVVYSIQGPLFFGVAKKIEYAFATTHADLKNVIFRLKYVPFMDITGLQTFKELIKRLGGQGVTVYLCEANAKVTHKIMRVGISRWIGANQVFHTFREAVKQLS